MSKQVIFTKSAPAPVSGMYSQAIIANGMIFCSGQVPLDPSTNKLIDGGIEEHTHQCMKNLQAVLKEAGSSLDNAVEVNIFLADMADFAKMNAVYLTYFPKEPKPARTCVAVKTLPLNTDVEIKLVALVG